MSDKGHASEATALPRTVSSQSEMYGAACEDTGRGLAFGLNFRNSKKKESNSGSTTLKLQLTVKAGTYHILITVTFM